MATQGTVSTTHHPSLDIGLNNHGYSLVAKKDSDQFRNLYSLGVCGANLEDVIFEFGAEDTFFTFSLPKNIKLAREEAHRLMCQQPSTFGNRNLHPSAKFGVIARPGNKAPVLFFGLCDCPSCKRSADVDLKLTSIVVGFQLNFGNSTFPLAGFPFHPACKEDYNMGSPLAKNLEKVLYFTNFWTVHSAMRDFIAHLRSIRVPEGDGVADTTTTIKFNSVAKTNAVLEDNHKPSELMLTDKAFGDFKLISSYDRNKYTCHKIVLSVQSKELKQIILQKQAKEVPKESRNTLTLTEDGKTISAFLQWIYCKSEEPISSCFDVASGLLRLGHEYHLPKLVAAAATVLTQKVKSGEWNNPMELWKLYKFVRLVDKIDVVVRLKIEIVTKLAKNMVTKKLEKVRATATEEMEALNGGQPVDQLVANDFIMDVVDLIKFDQ